jgi:NodT family efflux transporter outer membrane factor (OMF) lipoprotein
MIERKTGIQFAFLTCAGLALTLATGCRLGPKYQAPAPPAIAAQNYKESTVNFKDTEGWKVANPQDAMLRGDWWEVYNEPELNALEQQLNVNNQNIQVSFQNFMAARAVVAEARAQFWPTITTNPAWSRSRSSSNQKVSSAANTGTASSLWNLPIDVTWTPDLWGRIRNQVSQAKATAQVSAADLELEKLTEQSQLAELFFEIRGQDMLQQILNDTVAADQKTLDYTQAQYSTGIGTYISVAEAKTTLESATASAVAVGLLRNQYEHAIAMLVGKPATDFSIPVKPMIYAPPAIPTGVPSQLIERRPDVAAAERQVAAANYTIGIGYGAFFPNITLSAAGGLQSALFKHLFDLSSRIWSIGPSTSETIFNGGLYRADLHQYTAIYNADLASYRQTVLTAFQQVEDYLSSTRIYSEEIQRQQDAVNSAREYLSIELERYNTGLDPYVNVVIAQNTLLSAQASLNSEQVSEMIASVQLVQALGGGWNRSDLPSNAQLTAKPTAADYTMQH